MVKTALPSEPDHYATLGVPPSATSREIRQAYVELIRRHRDPPGETDVARIERARQINIAHDRLSDPVQRRAYDQARGLSRPREQAQHAPERAEPRLEPPPEVEQTAGPRLESRVRAEPPETPHHGDRWRGSAEDQGHAPVVEFRYLGRDRMVLATAALVALLGSAALLLPKLLPDAGQDALPPVSEAGPATERSVEAETLLEPGPAESADIESPASVEPTAAVQQAPVASPPGAAAEPNAAVTAQQEQVPAADRSGASAVQPRAVSAPAPAARAAAAPAPAARAPAQTPAGTRTEPATRRATALAGAPIAIGSSATAAMPATPARWVSGGLLDRDNPGGRLEGTVHVRFTVNRSGRATDCRPLAVSGDAALASITCRLVEQRLYFSPALDASGQPISSEMRTSYTWGRRQRR